MKNRLNRIWEQTPLNIVLPPEEVERVFNEWQPEEPHDLASYAGHAAIQEVIDDWKSHLYDGHPIDILYKDSADIERYIQRQASNLYAALLNASGQELEPESKPKPKKRKPRIDQRPLSSYKRD